MLTLKSNGFILDEEKEELKELLFYLYDLVELDSDYTLRSYFKMLERYEELTLLDYFAIDFIKEYLACPKSNCLSEGIEYLQLAKTLNIDFTYTELEECLDFRGMSTTEKYALDLQPLNTLLDIPLKLGKAETIIQQEITEYTTTFSLFEFVKSIIWELSFHGLPEERDAKRIEILQLAEEAKTLFKSEEK